MAAGLIVELAGLSLESVILAGFLAEVTGKNETGRNIRKVAEISIDVAGIMGQPA